MSELSGNVWIISGLIISSYSFFLAYVKKVENYAFFKLMLFVGMAMLVIGFIKNKLKKIKSRRSGRIGNMLNNPGSNNIRNHSLGNHSYVHYGQGHVSSDAPAFNHAAHTANHSYSYGRAHSNNLNKGNNGNNAFSQNQASQSQYHKSGFQAQYERPHYPSAMHHSRNSLHKRFCHQCGAPLINVQRYCSMCGARL